MSRSAQSAKTAKTASGSPSPSSFCSYSKTTRNVYARVSGAVVSTGELLQSWHICPFGLVVVFLAVVA